MAKKRVLKHENIRRAFFTVFKRKTTRPNRGRYFTDYQGGVQDSSCYSGVSWDKAKKIIIFLDGSLGYLKKYVPEESTLAHFNWLLNDSPFADCYGNVDAKDALENGFVIRPNVYDKKGFITHGLFASTLLNAWEYPDLFQKYLALVETGVDRLGALLLAPWLEELTKKTLTLKRQPYTTGHTTFGGAELHPMCLENIFNKKKATYRCQNSFGVANTIGIAQYLYGLGRKAEAEKGVVNFFPRANVKDNSMALVVDTSTFVENFNRTISEAKANVESIHRVR